MSSTTKTPAATGSSGGSGSSSDTSTFEAAKKGDVGFIQTAVLNGTDVNGKDNNGERWVVVWRDVCVVWR